MFTVYLDKEERDAAGRMLATAGILLCVSERSVAQTLRMSKTASADNLRPILEQKIQIVAKLLDLPLRRRSADHLTAASVLLSQQEEIVGCVEKIRSS